MMCPDWPVPATVKAVTTTRAGGVSVPPYNSFNLADHVGDAEPAVRENRLLLDGTQISLKAGIERFPVRALVIDFQGLRRVRRTSPVAHPYSREEAQCAACVPRRD